MQNRFGPLSPRKKREYTDGTRGGSQGSNVSEEREMNYSKDADKYFMQHSHSSRHRFKIPKLLLRPAVAGATRGTLLKCH